MCGVEISIRGLSGGGGRLAPGNYVKTTLGARHTDIRRKKIRRISYADCGATLRAKGASEVCVARRRRRAVAGVARVERGLMYYNVLRCDG